MSRFCTHCGVSRFDFLKFCTVSVQFPNFTYLRRSEVRKYVTYYIRTYCNVSTYALAYILTSTIHAYYLHAQHTYLLTYVHMYVYLSTPVLGDVLRLTPLFWRCVDWMGCSEIAAITISIHLCICISCSFHVHFMFLFLFMFDFYFYFLFPFLFLFLCSLRTYSSWWFLLEAASAPAPASSF